MSRIVAVIPAFNEENSIGNVIRDIPKDITDRIVVINNNSTDRTADVALALGAVVLREEKQGYGAACLKGIDYLKNLSLRPDIVVFIDADYSDYPEEMKNIVFPITHNDYDFVIGSRALGKREKGSMLPQQIFGNWLATTLLKWLYGIKYSDLGPFRAIRFQKLLELDMQDTTYGWTVEMQLKAAKQKLKIMEVPVSYRKRIGVSKITGTMKGTILAGYKIITTIFKYL